MCNLILPDVAFCIWMMQYWDGTENPVYLLSLSTMRLVHACYIHMFSGAKTSTTSS